MQSIRSDRLERIDPIDSIGSMQKWIPGQILSCLDLNFVQIGPKMVDFCHFCKIVPPFFDPKTGFFDSKTQTLHTFFEIFEIYIHFRIISELFSELFSELKLPNFFPNFFAKISEIRKFRFFPKNFRTSKTEHFRNSRKRKVRKFPSNAGP